MKKQLDVSFNYLPKSDAAKLTLLGGKELQAGLNTTTLELSQSRAFLKRVEQGIFQLIEQPKASAKKPAKKAVVESKESEAVESDADSNS